MSDHTRLKRSPRSFSRLVIGTLFVVGNIAYSYAANLVLTPSSVTTNVGKTFSVDITVNNNIGPINAVATKLSFPKDALQVISVSKKGSFINLWAEEPTYSNESGLVSLEGVALNPGFDKSSGKVLTVTFKAKQAGNVTISVASGQVLANDGNATDVLKTTGAAMVYINETDKAPEVVTTVTPVITSPTHPDSNLWYARRDATFEWKIPDDVTAVRTVYSDKEDSKPTKVYDPPVSNRSFTVDNDGTMYMAVQFKNGSGWGAVTRYKFNVDTEPPESLKASFPDGSVTTNQSPAILVQAEDKLSGIAKVTFSIDKGEAIEVPADPSGLYHLSKQKSGNHTVVVSAIDGAGNASTVSLDYTIQTINPPVITEYTRKVDFDTRFKIVGATYPKAKVEVMLTDTDGKIVTSQVTANDAGVFSYVWDKELSSGVYEMKARVLDDGRGSMSDYTETRVVVVEKMVLVRFGIFVMNWLSVALIVIVATLTIVATLWYSFLQFSRFRRKVKRKLAEVENTLRVNVQELRRDIEEFRDILIKAERKRELTKEEQMILKKFKKSLDITEKEIEKKLEQAV